MNRPAPPSLPFGPKKINSRAQSLDEVFGRQLPNGQPRQSPPSLTWFTPGQVTSRLAIPALPRSAGAIHD